MDPFNTAFATLEVKLAENAPEGTFSGYGAMFGNVDSHGDVIQSGAFADSLAERKSQGGRHVPMHVMHRVMGGDGLPVGVWTSVAEDGRGLRVQGKISGMNTETGRLLFEKVKDGALGGLSVGYKIKPNGAIYGRGANEPKRTLLNLHLGEISLVDEPSNPLTRVDQIKLSSRAEVEDFLQQSGLARGAARKMAGPAWAALSGEPDAPPPPDPAVTALLKALDTSNLELKALKDLFQ